MSKEVKAALIGAAAILLAAIISGIFMLHSTASSQSNATSTSPSPFSTSPPVVTPPVSTTTSTPEQTLTTFCTALKNGDDSTAYNQFSSQTKQQASEADFAAAIQSASTSNGGIAACTFSEVQHVGSTVTTVVTISYGNGQSVVDPANLVIENGAWKIDFTSQP